MANLLITGSNGQLGSELKSIADKKNTYFFTDFEELDITKAEAVLSFVTKNKITHIVNAAAYTAVDKAETEKEQAFAINSTAIKHLTDAVLKNKAVLIHISTDYVFDGHHYKPYLESDKTNPRCYYGKTKLDGEIEIMLSGAKAIIIRTSWLYSAFGHNFVKTMLRLADEKESINVVCDQIGNPTYAKDLAGAILQIIPQTDKLRNIEIYNYANEGCASWYDFATEIMKMSKKKAIINPIETKDYPTPAARPHYSVLNKAKIKQQFGLQIPYWKDSLENCLRELKQIP